MIGFEYRVGTAFDTRNRPYFFYRLVGLYRGNELLFIESGQGGPGEFTQLIDVKQRGNLIYADGPIAEGDRCNGSIYNVSLADGQLFYEQRISQVGLIRLGRDPSFLRAFAKTLSSATSCYAVVHITNQRWTTVTLTRFDIGNFARWPRTFPYDPCFDRIYRSYVVRRLTELNHGGITRFADSFFSRCIRAP